MRVSRVVVVLALMCAALFAVGGSPARDRQPSAKVAPVAAKRVKIRIGTYNLNHSNSQATFLKAIHQMLPHVDVVTFQEITGGTRFGHVIADIKGTKGWNTGWTVEYGDLVAYRTSKFKVLTGSTAVMAEGRYVEAPQSGALHFQHEIFGGITRLQEKSTGRVIVLVTAHPMAGAAPGGRPRPHRPRLVSMYRDIFTNLARVVPIQNRFGRVYLVGDWNIHYFSDAHYRTPGFPYRQFTRIGFQSMWAGHRPKTGTWGNAVIDGVWARQRPIRRQVLTGFPYSDHKPVVATYWLP